jgi:hypothetical protein
VVTRLFLPSVGDEIPEPIYTLTSTGARELARARGISAHGLVASARKPSFLFLEHGLQVSTFMCCLEAALQKANAELALWKGEHDLRTGRGRSLKVPDPFHAGERIPVIPDGLFALRKEGKAEFYFLEADRGTMSMLSMERKMLGYIQLFRRGMHLEVFGCPHFRVLFVTTTAYRREQMRSVLREIGYCRNMFLFALWKDIAPQTILESIWLKCHRDTARSIFD